MDNYFDYLKFKYNNSGSISSVEVCFGENEDSVIISKEYISELQKYTNLCEYDKELFFIIARAILLKKENHKKISNSVKQYNFGNISTFAKNFVSKLIETCCFVSVDLLAVFFNEAKVEDLDIFLNQKNPREFSLYLLGEFDVEP